MYKVVSEYAESILARMQNTPKEDKDKEYFAVYGEYANRHKIEIISANFRPKPKKILIQNHLTEYDRMAKKTIARYCPFKGYTFCYSTVRSHDKIQSN
jgi:hypothetical protein